MNGVIPSVIFTVCCTVLLTYVHHFCNIFYGQAWAPNCKNRWAWPLSAVCWWAPW